MSSVSLASCHLDAIPLTFLPTLTLICRPRMLQTRRAFFLTPQVFENDISTAICDASRVSLVVVDEAHKAVGQHSIVRALSYLHHRQANSSSGNGAPARASPSMGFRIVSLTATPGTKADSVQQVLTNCFVSKVEVRTEQDNDVKVHLPYKEIRKVEPLRLCVRPCRPCLPRCLAC
jgi:ATP-dependent DNA helicase MPH1